MTTCEEGFNAYFEGRSPRWDLVAQGVESEEVAAAIVELMCGAYEGFGRGSVKARIDDGPDEAPWVGALYRTPTGKWFEAEGGPRGYLAISQKGLAHGVEWWDPYESFGEAVSKGDWSAAQAVLSVSDVGTDLGYERGHEPSAEELESRFGGVAEFETSEVTTTKGGADMAEKTITLAALLGYEVPPPYDKSDEWLLANCEAVIYALRMEDLPEGGWVCQGMHERAVWITVSSDSPEASSAIANDEIKHRTIQRAKANQQGSKA